MFYYNLQWRESWFLLEINQLFVCFMKLQLPLFSLNSVYYKNTHFAILESLCLCDITNYKSPKSPCITSLY